MTTTALQWGTVTAAFAVLVAIGVHLRDRRTKRREAQWAAPDAVVVSPSRVSEDGAVHAKDCRIQAHVTNYGQFPIWDVVLIVNSHFIQNESFTAARTLGPGETLLLDEIVPSHPDPYPVPGNDSLLVSASFTDSGGFRWQKWAYGKIHIPIWRGPYRGRLPDWLMRCPPMVKINEKWQERPWRPPMKPAPPQWPQRGRTDPSQDPADE